MTIEKEDFERLCNIAKKLNDTEHEDYDYDQFELWEELSDIIDNIKE